MLEMDNRNATESTLAVGAADAELVNSGGGSKDSNEYLYIMIVMSFYGIFLMGIMMGYMKNKRKDKNSNLLLLYKDQEREWEEALKPLPATPGLRSVQVPMMLSLLQERMGPALYCSACTMEGSSLSSESSSPEVHFTIHEEVMDLETGTASEALLHESSDESSRNFRQVS
ncbi:potassium voltage-gated channel subfamily E member 4 [Lissotriton helveticus]